MPRILALIEGVRAGVLVIILIIYIYCIYMYMYYISSLYRDAGES